MKKVLSTLTLVSMLIVIAQSALAQDRSQVVSDIKANLCHQTDDNCYELEIILEGMFLEDLLTVAQATTIDEFNNILNSSSPSDSDVALTIGDPDMDYTFTPVSPCRIVDTRSSGGAFTAGQTRAYNVYGADMSAQGGNAAGCTSPVGEPRGVMINITVVSPSANGYIAAYPAGSPRPDAAIMSYRAGVNLSNAGGVKTFFGAGQELAIYSLSGTHLVIDVMGYYAVPALPAVDWTEITNIPAGFADGTDADSGGDITGVSAGTGLSGGGTSGSVTLNANTSYLQRRVSSTCPAGSSIRAISSTGTVTCESDSNSGGDITGVTAGTGLSGGGTSGSVTLNADTTYLQRRVTATCSTGYAIRAISSTGTVSCQDASQYLNCYTTSSTASYADNAIIDRTASCASGYEVTGGGYHSNNYFVNFWQLRPNSETSYFCSGRNNAGMTISFTCYARCCRTI